MTKDKERREDEGGGVRRVTYRIRGQSLCPSSKCRPIDRLATASLTIFLSEVEGIVSDDRDSIGTALSDANRCKFSIMSSWIAVG